MPTFYEMHLTRNFTVEQSTASITRNYFVQGTSDETEVLESIYIEAPITYQGLVRKSVRAENLGGGNWTATVEYAPIDRNQAAGVTPEPPVAPGLTEQLPASFSFDTTGSTLHITQSLETICRFRAGDAALPGTGPDFKQAIRVTKDKVEGCDIFVPKMEWQLEVHRASCTGQYLKTLSDLTGTVNEDLFYGGAQGCVLYLGASGKFTNKDRWSITHRFSYQPTKVNFDVGGGITVLVKKGWEYLWVGYKPAVDANALTSVPDAAYVERVYPYGNFELLEVG